MADITHKVCTLCRQEKPLEKFNRNNQGIAGRTSRCKGCLKPSEEQKDKWRPKRLQQYPAS